MMTRFLLFHQTQDTTELPVALYEEIHFKSDSGLNEIVQVSRLGVAEKLKVALSAMKAEPLTALSGPQGQRLV